MQQAPARAPGQSQAGPPAQAKRPPKPPDAPVRNAIQSQPPLPTGVPPPPPPPASAPPQGGGQGGKGRNQRWKSPQAPGSVPPPPPPPAGRAPPFNVWGQNSAKLRDRMMTVPKEAGESKNQWKTRAIKTLRKWGKKPTN